MAKLFSQLNLSQKLSLAIIALGILIFLTWLAPSHLAFILSVVIGSGIIALMTIMILRE